MRKLFIWGAGDIGRRIIEHLGNDWEITFVDSNERIEGSYYCKRKVVGTKKYLEEHSNEFILISHLQEEKSIEILKKNKIINFFIHCDLPGEFKEPYVRDDFKEYILNYLKDRDNYVLYGLNLYSIIVHDWIYKRFRYHPCILLQDNISEEFVDKVKQQYEGLKLITNIKERNDITEVCICTNDYEELEVSGVFSEYQMTDIFDCSDKISSYHNPAIIRFHNLHEGERCFIVATGPSLEMKDLDVLKHNKEICISMNSIFYAFDRTDWRPDYYVISDYRCFNEYNDILDNFPVKQMFLSDTSESFWKVPHGDNIFRYHQHYEYFFNRYPKFSNNFSLKSYMGTTVTYTCMQLAVYMGFTEIYLLGVDFSYSENKSNKKYAHFYKEKELEATGFVNQVRLAYEAAEAYTKKHGIKIYNATRGGKLEIFERVGFDSLFKKDGSN